MPEYIEKEALAKQIREEYDLGYGEILIDPKNFADMVDFAPAADVEPVVHGRWVNIADKPHLFYECSLCKEKWGYGAMLHMKYCPHCGARMDGEG